MEKKKSLNNLSDLLNLTRENTGHTKLVISKNDGSFSLDIMDCEFCFRLNKEELRRLIKSVMNGIPALWPSSLHFIQCDFKHSIDFKGQKIGQAVDTAKELPDIFTALEFDHCDFTVLAFEDARIYPKMRFRKCYFRNINFNNTKFHDLADFWCCDFLKPTTFYKTDFLGTTVFSGSTFHQPALFTYSLIEKLIIFRGTKFKKGLDLSLAIIPGDISCFDIQVTPYSPYVRIPRTDEEIYETNYEAAVTDNNEIPVNNARETFRILKQTLIAQNNVSDSILFKVLEKETLQKELKFRQLDEKEKSSEQKETKSESHHIRLERFNLWLNAVSNKHGKSYGQAFIFILAVSVPSFYFSIISLDQYQASLNFNHWEWSLLGKYVEFLVPTHRFDYLKLGENLKFGFYFFDFLGRIFVGYGIYQFIQAFRKYR